MGYCAVCKESWKSVSWAHCSGCHRTFRSVGGFEKHRRDMKCLDPDDLGMKMDEKGCWYTPLDEKAKKRMGIASKP